MRYDEKLQGFPEDALKRAQYSGEVLEVREHFFEVAGVPHLALVMSLSGDAELTPANASDLSWKSKSHKGPDFYLMMPEPRKNLFSAIRKWRNEQAAGKFPPYVIARNSMIAELTFRVPKTMTALREVDGCGDSFCEKYGESLLALLKESDLEPEELPEDFVQAKEAEDERPSKKKKV